MNKVQAIKRAVYEIETQLECPWQVQIAIQLDFAGVTPKELAEAQKFGQWDNIPEAAKIYVYNALKDIYIKRGLTDPMYV